MEQWRRAWNRVAPARKEKPVQPHYDIYPSFPVGEGQILAGYESLAGWMTRHRRVRLDGYVGIIWDDLIGSLDDQFKSMGISVSWIDINAFLRNEEEINAFLDPFIGTDDPLFGKRCSLDLGAFYHTAKLNTLTPDENTPLTILYGIGAGLAPWEGPLIYIDLPKNEIQFRSRAGSITNLGMRRSGVPRSMYKRFYFVDWPVLNRYKQKILPAMDLVVDGQRPDMPLFMNGAVFRNALARMAVNAFRVRPWFEPGPWGGQWIKCHMPDLNQEVDNYAWSFELIVPENGLMFESDGHLLEVSFDFLMFQESEKVLGRAADRFKEEFPIRFDFLDTVDGGNLSVQVHPRESYIKAEFGESFTQDETYYILDAKKDALVNLGFQAGIDAMEFRKALEESFEKGLPVDMEKYVQQHPSRKHDLFLIPNGTIHGSGEGNLVLEISSTPYIFTFKLYDWLRPDLDGRPRTLNIDRGFENLDFNRQGAWVKEHLISRPEVVFEKKGAVLVHLPTHPNHFYDVFRYEFDKNIRIMTDRRCHVMMLVEGEHVTLETEQGMEFIFHYAETFVVPAACGSYRLKNRGSGRAKVVQAYVK
jgi:mannose-6-phosphate isomerase class I